MDSNSSTGSECLSVIFENINSNTISKIHNPLCHFELNIEMTTDFFLYYHNFTHQRQTLFDSLSQINHDMNENLLINLLWNPNYSIQFRWKLGTTDSYFFIFILFIYFSFLININLMEKIIIIITNWQLHYISWTK